MNERILNLLSLCMQAKEKGHDCFFNYSPHCHMVSLEIYLSGWRDAIFDGDGNVVKDFTDKRFCFYYGGDAYDEMEDRTKLEEAENYIKELIEWQAHV